MAALRAELDSFWTRELDQLVRDAGVPLLGGLDAVREVGPRPAQRGRDLHPDHPAGPAAPLAGRHRPRRPAGRRGLPVDHHPRARGGRHLHRGGAGPPGHVHLGLGGLGRGAAGRLDRNHHPGAVRRRDPGPPGPRRPVRRAGGQPRRGLDPLPRPARHGRRRGRRRSRRVGRRGQPGSAQRRRGHPGHLPADPARRARSRLSPCHGVPRVRRDPAGRSPDRLGRVSRRRRRCCPSGSGRSPGGAARRRGPGHRPAGRRLRRGRPARPRGGPPDHQSRDPGRRRLRRSGRGRTRRRYSRPARRVHRPRCFIRSNHR